MLSSLANVKKGANMKKSTKILIICLVVISPIFYKILNYYVFTIEVHVPIIGYVDTGITKYQLNQFKLAGSEYSEQEKKLSILFRNNKISRNEHNDKMAKINISRLSDPRITAVIGGPSKKVSSFLLEKL